MLDHLNLHNVTLAGFSMGGGEVERYFGMYGGARVAKVVFISAVVPYMRQTADKPDGVPQEVFDDMLESISEDRPKFLEDFNKDFYGIGLISKPVSEVYLTNAMIRGMEASPIATIECAKAFAQTDFRKDVRKINVPTLVIHGSDDKTVPVKATGEQTAAIVPGAVLKIYDSAPHGLWFTNRGQLNQDIIDFI